MEKGDLHINYSDLERFLQNLKANELANLKARINNSIEEVYKAMESNSVSTSVGTLPEATANTQGAIYVDQSLKSYISVNTGTEESPVYTWVPLNSSSDSFTAEECKDSDNYEDVF